jgi:hypothetical protein
MPSTSTPASKNEVAAAEITALAAGAGPPEKTIATRFTLFTTPNCKPESAVLPSFAASALLGAIDMPIDVQSIGYETAPIEFDYTWRDTVVYALGVGASPEEELDYLYEGRGPKDGSPQPANGPVQATSPKRPATGHGQGGGPL